MDKKHVSVWGRNLEEYKKMFGLSELTKSLKIISVADGPSAFNVQLRQLGVDITSVDPIYNLSIAELKMRFKESYAFNRNLFIEQTDNFNFKNDGEIEKHLAKRENTFNTFITDYELHPNYYHYGMLPVLAFESNSFDLCLCSNFLFIFDHIFNMAFHLNSIKEMLRVSNEVRIFPVYNTNGKRSVHLDNVLEFLTTNNFICEVITNDYHVYKDGNRFLKITR